MAWSMFTHKAFQFHARARFPVQGGTQAHRVRVGRHMLLLLLLLLIQYCHNDVGRPAL